MKVTSFLCSPFQENTYICHDDERAVLIDPGCYDEAERQEVLEYLRDNRLTVDHLLLTHGHIDHIFGCAFFSAHFDQAFRMHCADAPLLEHARTQAEMFGVDLEPPPAPVLDLEPGVSITFGNAQWEILHCPGHSPGSVCFYDATNGILIGGDVLFYGSIGRTDLWQGSMELLLTSIRTELWALPDDTVVYSGHGPETSIGFEKRHNPFLRDLDF